MCCATWLQAEQETGRDREREAIKELPGGGGEGV